MNKRAVKTVLSLFWFLLLFIVAFAVVYIVSIFYGSPYDVRQIEAHTMSDQIADCVASQGYINSSVFTQDFRNNFLADCHLNFNTEDIYDWKNSTQYYTEVKIYMYDPNSFNLLGQQVFNVSEGNINLKLAWQLSLVPKAPSQGSSLASSITSIFSPSRKVNTIVIHTTEGSTAAGAIETISNRALSVHYMIDRNGDIYSSENPPAQFADAFVPEKTVASHAGCGEGSSQLPYCTLSSGCIDSSPVSSNGILDTKCQQLTGSIPKSQWCCIPGFNTNSIGIELVNLGEQCTNINGGFCANAVSLGGYKWENFSNSPDQMNSLVNLVANIALRYNIPVDRSHIIGHYQITTYKTDPGPDFPWDKFLSAVKVREAEMTQQTGVIAADTHLPQGVLRSFYALDNNGEKYIVQVLTIVRKTEKNVA